MMLAVMSGFMLSCNPDCIQGEGDSKTEARNPGTYDGIKLEIPADVVVEQSLTPEFTINAQANILANIQTEVSNGTLIIKSKECFGNYNDIKISVKLPEVSKMIINGSGSIKTNGKIKSEHLEFGINGSGDIEAEADAASIYSGIKGSGSLKIKGTAKQQYVKISGSGSYEAADLAAVEGDFSIAGSGSMRVYVLEKLNAKVAGSGEITYKGSPKTSINVEGSGKVVKVD